MAARIVTLDTVALCVVASPPNNAISLTQPAMLTLALYALVFVIGVAVGAYSHKWLAKVTGAPANLTPATAVPAAEAAAKTVAAEATAAVKKAV